MPGNGARSNVIPNTDRLLEILLTELFNYRAFDLLHGFTIDDLFITHTRAGRDLVGVSCDVGVWEVGQHELVVS